MKANPVSDELSECIKDSLSYNSATGVLTWKKRMARAVKAGDIAGKPGNGYCTLMIKGRTLLAHRVAWFLSYGNWPVFIDHINGNRSDNRLCNLRECTKMTNGWNRPKNRNTFSGLKGVYFHKAVSRDRPWVAKLRRNGVDIHLGYFATKEEAFSVYRDFVLKNDGEFANTKTINTETSV